MTALWTFIVAVLRVLIPAFLDKVAATATDSSAPEPLKAGIKSKIEGVWGVVGCLVLVVFLFGGCVTFMPRTVYVADGEPVRLRQDVEDCKVWVMTEDGAKPSTLTLEEGWYCVSYKNAEAVPE